MKKIPTFFVRDPNTNFRYVTDDVNPACQWVADGEGIATRKFDGTCVLIRDGVMFSRREVVPGKHVPSNFEEVDHDDLTGKSVGWIPVNDGPEFARHWEAFSNSEGLGDGTYELVGPKVNGNPEGYPEHTFVKHGVVEMSAPRTYGKLSVFFSTCSFEGIVWWREPGNLGGGLAKLKRRDFDGWRREMEHMNSI